MAAGTTTAEAFQERVSGPTGRPVDKAAKVGLRMPTLRQSSFLPARLDAPKVVRISPTTPLYHDRNSRRTRPAGAGVPRGR